MFRFRPVDPDDLDLIARHRAAMFRDSGRSADVVAAMEAPFRAWLRPRLADESYFGWMVNVADGSETEPVAGLGMMEIDWPPHPNHPADARRGYILNVYVEPPFRRRGIARTLMVMAREEALRRGLSYLILHATAEGQALYRQLGWTATAEMALSIPGSVD